MPRKQIGGIESDVIFTGGILLGGYFLVKQLIPDLIPNIGVTDADRAVLDQQQTTDPTNDPFNSLYSGMLGYFDAVIPDMSKYQADTSDQAVFNAYTVFKHGGMSPDDPLYPTMVIYINLVKALVGHLITGDQQSANTYMHSITSKSQCAFISYLFDVINGKSLWEVLRNGIFPTIYGLNGADLATVTNYINSLPN